MARHSLCRLVCWSMTVARRWHLCCTPERCLRLGWLRSTKQRKVGRLSAAFRRDRVFFHFAVLGTLCLSGGTLTHSWASPESGSRQAGVLRGAAHAACS